MKHLITAICLVFSLLVIQYDAAAQPNHGITFRTLWYNYDNPNPDWANWEDVFGDANGRGVEVGYSR
ncbi:MAG TPA: hypothetical protein PK971_13495, partial [Saprospiraceae bacterium]|nr:hypothetical protein [Saprospiraceae bacterium]